MHRTRRSVVTALVVTVLALTAVVGVSQTASRAADPTAAAPTWPVSHEGRWLTDAQGRALLVHGVNFVAKEPGVTPADMGFGADDAQWLVDNGFEVVRLGTTAASIMPSPGVVDTAYLDSFAQTVHLLTDHGLLVLVDLHQDGWGPTLGSDGFPDWMTITHGATNTHTDFPLYYITNPAIQAAFQSFWDDEDGPDGVPLQDSAAKIWKALAGAVAGDPGVIGYDLLNEPWPGTTWQDCISPEGCPVQDAALDAFGTKMTQAIRSVDPTGLVFGEPYVLFNFGQGPTHISLPGGDPASGMAWHMYTADPALEPAVVDFAAQWAAGTGGALLNTEFGAVSDPAAIDRMTGELDNGLMPWIWWAYNEQILLDAHEPPTDANLYDLATVGAIVRPHPVAVAGTPEALDYDPSSRTLDFSFTPERVGGGTFPANTVTSFALPDRSYPDGYQVDVRGGHVTSAPGATQLTVVADAGGSCVSVAVAPAGGAAPVAAADGCATPTTTTSTPTTTTVPTSTSVPAGSAPTVPVSTATEARPAVAVRAEPSFTG
jgi:endoglycosylceramidase